MRTRLNPADRKEAILKAALIAAAIYGYLSMTRKNVAILADCSEALVSAYFDTMVQMRRATVMAAIDRCDLRIIAQAIVAKSPLVRKLPAHLREMALAAVS